MSRQAMNLVDAAKQLNISVDGLRKRIQRKAIKAKKNKQGRWMVEVDVQETVQDKDHDKTYTDSKDVDQDMSSALIDSMRQQIETLKQELDLSHKENERRDSIIMSLTSRIPPQLAAPKQTIWQRLRKSRQKTTKDTL